VAKRETKVSEEKLKELLKNWPKMSIADLGVKLGVGESTVNYWAGKLRKQMKASGITDEEIKKLLPSKRVERANLFEKVINDMKEKAEKEKAAKK
jgi:hypothetical protein